MHAAPLRIATAGLGAIGIEVARALDAGIPGLVLTAVAARDRERARARCAQFRAPPEVRRPEELPALADVIVECAPAAAFTTIARPAIEAGRILVCASVGALLDHMDLVDRAARTGGRILIPSGALVGLDAVQAAVLGGHVDEVRLVTRKPPAGLDGVPYLIERGVDVHASTEPTRVFEGSAREGARHFPANVNVAAALGLAGIGPDRTRLEIWVDPTVTRNTHTVTVEAAAVRLTLRIENVPSETNPRTGRLVAPSVIATLRKLKSPLAVGT